MDCFLMHLIKTVCWSCPYVRCKHSTYVLRTNSSSFTYLPFAYIIEPVICACNVIYLNAGNLFTFIWPHLSLPLEAGPSYHIESVVDTDDVILPCHLHSPSRSQSATHACSTPQPSTNKEAAGNQFLVWYCNWKCKHFRCHCKMSVMMCNVW